MSIRMRHTKGHTRNRRSHHGLEETRVSTDKETGARHLRHRASRETGTYRGRSVLKAAVATQPAKAVEKTDAKKTSTKKSKKEDAEA